MDTIKCNGVIEMMLSQGNVAIGKIFDSDVLFLKSSMYPPLDDAVKHEIEEMKALKGKDKSKDKLTVIVETNGGYVETVERIVSVFRQHYASVEYVVPNYAYSAGTILVLSGDELYMDYYSVLGPIDPQIGSDDGNASVPGMGYLAKFEELVSQINDTSKSADEIRAQTAYLIKRFDPANLFTIEQAIEHSKALLRDWLPKYKFKAWTVKETSGAPVTDADRKQRADEIADALGNAKHWHSHGRGVGIKELTDDLIKLKVKNFGENATLNQNLSQYYGLLTDYMAKNRHTSALHSKRGLRRLS
ncbi:MAG: ATP-dependent Clp protease proteolytic subunit [Proteobacteria bacterium]|nr:ATP-dependent Clp protease proteolytic subunit [Pseudomonadota bacterium]